MKTLNDLRKHKIKILKQQTIDYFSKYFEIKESMDECSDDSQYIFCVPLISKNHNCFYLILENITPEIEDSLILGRFFFQNEYFYHGLHYIKDKENLFENMKNRMIEIEKNILALEQE